MKEISVRTSSRIEMVDISPRVRNVIEETGVHDGICTVYCPHTTAAVTINENADPSVASDILMMLNKLIPFNGNYTHLEGNSAAHIKSSIIGNTVQVIVENGSLRLGTWQGIFFCEFDGPRNRKVLVQIK